MQDSRFGAIGSGSRMHLNAKGGMINCRLGCGQFVFELIVVRNSVLCHWNAPSTPHTGVTALWYAVKASKTSAE